MEALIGFAVLYLGTVGVFVWQLRVTDARLKDTTRLFEGIVAREIDGRKAEHDAHREEVASLLTRIQAPEAAPFILGQTPEKQYVSAESDEEGWDAIERMNGN